MTATAPHQDKPFSHGPHIIATVFTFGAWGGIWLWRWMMHKVDRNREALYEIALHLDAIEARLDRNT